MSNSRKILFLTPQLPYPPVSGGVIKSYRLVQYLHQHYGLHLACLLKGDDDLASLQQAMPELSVVSQAVNIARTPLNFLKSWLAKIPLTIYRNANEEFKAKVASIADQFDLILVDHYLMHQYVPAGFRGRVVVHEHNAEFLIWQRMAEQTSFWLKRHLLQYEAQRICQYELSMCEQADAVLAAPNDQQALIDMGADPNGFYDTFHLGDEQSLDYKPLNYTDTRVKLLFIGTLSWQANLDGLIWFLQSVWPKIKAKMPKVGFSIVGGYSEAIKQQLLAVADDIELLGFVDDLEPLFLQHRVFVAPLCFGSGIKVKVVNSLYRGIPTVTTSIGAEGLDVVHGEHLFIANDAEGFADDVVTLLNTPQAWRRLSEQSRQLMQQRYTWQRVFEHLEAAICGDK